jgi:hypothetical protein
MTQQNNVFPKRLATGQEQKQLDSNMTEMLEDIRKNISPRVKIKYMKTSRYVEIFDKNNILNGGVNNLKELVAAVKAHKKKYQFELRREWKVKPSLFTPLYLMNVVNNLWGVGNKYAVTLSGCISLGEEVPLHPGFEKYKDIPTSSYREVYNFKEILNSSVACCQGFGMYYALLSREFGLTSNVYIVGGHSTNAIYVDNNWQRLDAMLNFYAYEHYDTSTGEDRADILVFPNQDMNPKNEIKFRYNQRGYRFLEREIRGYKKKYGKRPRTKGKRITGADGLDEYFRSFYRMKAVDDIRQYFEGKTVKARIHEWQKTPYIETYLGTDMLDVSNGSYTYKDRMDVPNEIKNTHYKELRDGTAIEVNKLSGNNQSIRNLGTVGKFVVTKGEDESRGVPKITLRPDRKQMAEEMRNPERSRKFLTQIGWSGDAAKLSNKRGFFTVVLETNMDDADGKLYCYIQYQNKQGKWKRAKGNYIANYRNKISQRINVQLALLDIGDARKVQYGVYFEPSTVDDYIDIIMPSMSVYDMSNLKPHR